LHGHHCHIDVVIVALDLLFVGLLPLAEMLQGFTHARFLLLSLETLSVFAPNIARDGIKNILVSILSCNFALFFQLKKEKDCMCFDVSEGLSRK
jgi:hypothetical protein